jgi:phage N-6-adenine-methyltransferase
MTPPEFLAAVRERWNIQQFAVDLAASENNVGAAFIITPEIDSLQADWTAFQRDLWLNPPFGNIAPWAEKCALSTINSRFTRDRRIFFLVPAAVGSRWFERYVQPYAHVYFLRDRICFDGKYVYPKDCLLAVYGEHPGSEFWKWKSA